MTTHIADYEAQRQAFYDLLGAACRQRILLFKGDSGSGKTALLSHCQNDISTTVKQVPIQLRGSAVDVAEIFYRAGGVVAWKKLKRFTDQVAQFQKAASVKIDRNWLVGMGNHINVALQGESLTDRSYRRAALTEAWFDDIHALPEPLLMVFDTYEQATEETKEWLCGPFLARVAQVDQLRVVIAGQSVPDRHNIEWGGCCREESLYGVTEARHWLPVIEKAGRHIPNDSPPSWLAGVCYALGGNPAAIVKIIEGLPLRSALS